MALGSYFPPCGRVFWAGQAAIDHDRTCHICRLHRARARNLVERLRLMAEEALSGKGIGRRQVTRKNVIVRNWADAEELAWRHHYRLRARAERIEAKYLREGT